MFAKNLKQSVSGKSDYLLIWRLIYRANAR
jgi:hypothetical protein